MSEHPVKDFVEDGLREGERIMIAYARPNGSVRYATFAVTHEPQTGERAFLETVTRCCGRVMNQKSVVVTVKPEMPS